MSGLFLLELGYCFGFLVDYIIKEGRLIVMARNLGHLSLRVSQRATQQLYANDAACRLHENPLRLIINNYIRFPLSFYMT